MFFASVGAAHAHPDFALVEAEARAGDTVHFSITGANGTVTYDLEIGDHDVVEDAVGAGKVVVGQFTLPHLGDSSKTVTVEAEMRDSRHKKTVKRKLRYLGPALPATGPSPAPVPVPAAKPPAPAPPAAGPPAAQDPGPGVQPPAGAPAALAPAEPSHAEQRTATPGSRKRRVRRRARRGRKHAKVRTKAPNKRYTTSSVGRSPRKPARKKTRSRRPAPRTAPLFDGIPERSAVQDAPGKGGGYASLNAITPTAAVLTGPGAELPAGKGGGISAAVLVPGLMGVAAMALTGTALHRRRRLR